jgi:Phage integrase family
LLEDGLQHVEHEALASPGQAAELLEVTLELGGRAAFAAAIGQAEQGFDGEGEVLGQGGQERDREAGPAALRRRPRAAARCQAAPNNLSRLTRDYLVAAGIAKRGACHLLRHTMATGMLEHGADVRVIQEILGHARLTTTQLSTRASIRLLKAVHTATHPAATLARPAAPPAAGDGAATSQLEKSAASLLAAKEDAAPPRTGA